jgi:predicted DNA-binding transcriptional regulator AlpA
MKKADAQTELARIGLTPRLLSRDQAAAYVALGTSAFDQAVAKRIMPSAKRIEGRILWDRHQIDKAVDRLPNDSPGDGGD